MAQGVHLLPPENMYTWCRAWDSKGACEDFQKPPADVIARFDSRLPQVLAAHGLERLAGSIQSYLRQYWAKLKRGRLYVVGNFVCRSIADIGLDTDYETGAQLPPDISHDSFPITVDDAGDCSVTVEFPADTPEEVSF
jgi:hypothetical protein